MKIIAKENTVNLTMQRTDGEIFDANLNNKKYIINNFALL